MVYIYYILVTTVYVRLMITVHYTVGQENFTDVLYLWLDSYYLRNNYFYITHMHPCQLSDQHPY